MAKKLKNKKLLLLSLASIIILLLVLSGILYHTVFSNQGAAQPASVTFTDPETVIIPKPVECTVNPGSFTLTKKTVICVNGGNDSETEEIAGIGRYLADIISPSTGFTVKVKKSSNPKAGSIYLTTQNGDASLGDEGYHLEVTKEGAAISAYTPEGLFRGIQTIRQMLPSEIEKDTQVTDVSWSIACADITDYPVYPWRGMMLDVTRHFFSVEDVKRTIDLMSQYKMNRFHLHLSDDQGWRIEIKAWPDLTAIGGSTEVGGGDGGYYTQKEYSEIVKYAQDRYIMVIPEIDMPGHMNAALASYGELNPDGQKKDPYTKINVGFSSLMCRSEMTYTFIDDVIKELAAITPGEYIHIGGDEADSTSREDYDYFIGRVNGIVASYGKKAIGWNPYETSAGTTADSGLLQFWKTNESDTALDKNMKIIMSPANRAYIDMKYAMSTKLGLNWAGYITTKFAYEWDPTDYAPKDNVMGIECCLWTETVKTMEDIEYLAYPRLPGHAEIGWTPKELRSWDEYMPRLKNQAKRMEYEGINYYQDKVVDW